MLTRNDTRRCREGTGVCARAQQSERTGAGLSSRELRRGPDGFLEASGCFSHSRASSPNASSARCCFLEEVGVRFPAGLQRQIVHHHVRAPSCRTLGNFYWEPPAIKQRRLSPFLFSSFRAKRESTFARYGNKRGVENGESCFRTPPCTHRRNWARALRARLVRCAGAEDGLPAPTAYCWRTVAAAAAASFRTQERAARPVGQQQQRRPAAVAHLATPCPALQFPRAASTRRGARSPLRGQRPPLLVMGGGSPDHWSVPRTAHRLLGRCSSGFESASPR
ncbi:hypothetical protein HPB50_003485 [Hyalomma asiaticum]|uniref:Uncharacterized protein n=1 Tax=Hyalomma asiaticum TaxID=266040 RepID=A0ACB7SE54_HYAAI|nr:hypothetical protein HPB50_003485 [Hyalomma asiaticum]